MKCFSTLQKLLAFRRTSLEVLARTNGRSFICSERKNPLLEHVERKDFIHRLAYPEDIFNHMNEINL
jgi:hypothetical protein